jgi:hypothetical protein
MARRTQAEAESAELARLEQAWRRLRAGEAALAPDALAGALLLARDGARAFRVVAAGVAASRLTGLAFGADATCAFAPASRARAARLLARAAASPEPLRARLPLAEGAGWGEAPARLLLLPLRNAAHGETCLIAGFAAPQGPHGNRPLTRPF